MTLKTSDYRYIGYIDTAYKSGIVGKNKEVVLKYSINETKYYKFDSIAYAQVKDSIEIAAQKESDADLLNRPNFLLIMKIILVLLNHFSGLKLRFTI